MLAITLAEYFRYEEFAAGSQSELNWESPSEGREVVGGLSSGETPGKHPPPHSLPSLPQQIDRIKAKLNYDLFLVIELLECPLTPAIKL